MRAAASRSRLHTVVALASLLLAALTACTVPEPATPSPSSGNADVADSSPAFHVAPERHWMNDPQRPVFVDGRWHLYYLYNADYPEGNGTSWYHVTSEDLVTWRDEGVAIEKYRNGLGDIQSGSAVVDHTGSAGFGEGALVALVTQQDAGVQRQSLFYSTDGGYSFDEYDGNPVMDNPGEEHWRDPKVFRDEKRDQWVMLLAEGQRLGFYTSSDLKSWTYRSDFAVDGLGLLECPDLFELRDPASGESRWVLGASANGAAEGRSTGFAYWTGSWDGAAFKAESEHRWLDDGADFYAAVTWAPEGTNEPPVMRHALGWVNSWAYATSISDGKRHGGSQSIVRDIRLDTSGATAVLHAEPTAGLTAPLRPGDERPAVTATDTPETVVPSGHPGFRLDVTARAGDAEELVLTLRGSGGEVVVDYDFAEGEVRIDRAGDAFGASAEPPPGYDVPQVSHGTGGGDAELSIFVDRGTLEVFLADGRSLTSLTRLGTGGIEVLAQGVGGDVILEDITYAPIPGPAQ